MADRKGLRPFFSFYGGKWRAAGKYPAPTHDTIIEPFAGSAGYSVRNPDKDVILVERDPVIASVWRYLIEASRADIMDLPSDIGGGVDEHEYLAPEERALIGFWLNKGAARPRRKPSAWMRGGSHPNSFWGEAVKARTASQVDRIRHWTLIEGDYTQSPFVCASATWFIDPPYQGMGRHYRFGSKDLDFVDLGQWCRARRGQVIVCENKGADWLPFGPAFDIKSMESKTGGKVSREVMWCSDDLA